MIIPLTAQSTELSCIEERPLKSNWMILKLTSRRTYGTLQLRHSKYFQQHPVVGSIEDQSWTRLHFVRIRKRKSLTTLNCLIKAKVVRNSKISISYLNHGKFLVPSQVAWTHNRCGWNVFSFFGMKKWNVANSNPLGLAMSTVRWAFCSGLLDRTQPMRSLWPLCWPFWFRTQPSHLLN